MLKQVNPSSLIKNKQRGITTIEYVLLAIGIAGLIAGLVIFLGDGLQAAFISLCNTVGGAGTCE